MRKLAYVALLAATAMATPAFAQDKAPFTGPRAEGVVGYDNISGGSDNSSESSDGVVYGGAIGYDVQAGGVVIGAEAELTGSTTDIRANGVDVAGDELVVGAGRDIYLGARVGAPVSDRALIYAKGGYTNARVNTTYSVGSSTLEDHVDLDGWRVGAGVEYKVSPNVYVKGEYRYSNYPEIEGYEIDLDRNQVVAGVGIRF